MPGVQGTCFLVLLGDHGAEKTRALLSWEISKTSLLLSKPRSYYTLMLILFTGNRGNKDGNRVIKSNPGICSSFGVTYISSRVNSKYSQIQKNTKKIQ